MGEGPIAEASGRAGGLMLIVGHVAGELGLIGHVAVDFFIEGVLSVVGVGFDCHGEGWMKARKSAWIRLARSYDSLLGEPGDADC